MVQIVDMQEAPSMWGSMGLGFGQGISSGINSMMEEAKQERSLGLQHKLSDMLDAKKMARVAEVEGAKGVALLKLMLPKTGEQAPTKEEIQLAYAGGTNAVSKYLELKEAERLRNARRGELGGKPGSKGNGTSGMLSNIETTNNQSQIKSPEITGITPPQPTENIQALPQQPNYPMYNQQYDQQAQALGLPNVGPGGLPIGLPGRQIPTAIPNVLPTGIQRPIGQELPQAPVSGVTQQMPLPTTTSQVPTTAQNSGAKSIYDMTEDEFNNFASEQQLNTKDMNALTAERNAGIKRKQDARKLEIEEEENTRKRQAHALAMEEAPKELQPYITEMSDRRAALRDKKKAINMARMAIRTGDTSGIIQFLAHKYNIDPLKTTGTAILESSAKEFLLSNISRGGTRPNQWFEQQVYNMFMKPGRPEGTNLSLADLYENDAEQEEIELDIFDRILDEDKQKYGRVRRDIQKRVDKEMRPYALLKNNELANTIQERRESRLSDQQMNSMFKVEEGTPLTPRKKKAILDSVNQDREAGLKLAAKLGYRNYKTTMPKEVR